MEPSVNAGQKTGISFCSKVSGSPWRNCRTYFICPVVHGLLVINLLPQAADERARRPHLAICLLFLKHRVQYWGQPVFEFAVVVVRHDEVTDTIHAASPQVSAIEGEVSEIGFSEALDKVLLDAARDGNDASDVLVFH